MLLQDSQGRSLQLSKNRCLINIQIVGGNRKEHSINITMILENQAASKHPKNIPRIFIYPLNLLYQITMFRGVTDVIMLWHFFCNMDLIVREYLSASLNIIFNCGSLLASLD